MENLARTLGFNLSSFSPGSAPHSGCRGVVSQLVLMFLFLRGLVPPCLPSDSLVHPLTAAHVLPAFSIPLSHRWVQNAGNQVSRLPIPLSESAQVWQTPYLVLGPSRS